MTKARKKISIVVMMNILATVALIKLNLEEVSKEKNLIQRVKIENLKQLKMHQKEA